MPVRKVITPSGPGFRGCYPSWLLGRMVAGESWLELDAIPLFEFSAAVATYEEQPLLVDYPDELKIRNYYPDFLITHTDETQCWIEVKPSKKLLEPKNAAKYRAIAAHFLRQGQTYRILTEEDIYREPLRSNLRLLQRHLFHSAPAPEVVRRIIHRLSAGPQQAAELGIPAHQLWCLVGRRILFADLISLPLGPETFLTVEGDRHAAHLY